MSWQGMCPLGLEELLGYRCGELSEEAATAVEDHVFACERCARDLESVERLGDAVAAAVRAAMVSAAVDGAFLERMRRDGLTLHEYTIDEGATIPCSARAEDFVVVRLRARFAAVDDLRIVASLEDLERGATLELPPRETFVDRAEGTVTLLFPGAVVRAYPRSRWTLRLLGEGPEGAVELGPFVMDHTP